MCLEGEKWHIFWFFNFLLGNGKNALFPGQEKPGKLGNFCTVTKISNHETYKNEANVSNFAMVKASDGMQNVDLPVEFKFWLIMAVFSPFWSKPGIFRENSNFLEGISWSLISRFLFFHQEMCNSTCT